MEKDGPVRGMRCRDAEERGISGRRLRHQGGGPQTGFGALTGNPGGSQDPITSELECGILWESRIWGRIGVFISHYPQPPIIRTAANIVRVS